MPELPEIETIRRDLIPHLQGHAVVHVEVGDRRLLSKSEEDQFRKIICGQPWETLYRKGKYLGVKLASRWEIVFHLRMTGQLIMKNPKKEQRSGKAGASPRLLLRFDHGKSLAFYDQRRFGEVFVISPSGSWPGKTVLGPDPINGLSGDEFVRMVKARTTRIKPLLMDQSFVAGVGNIYAQEALFKAGIRPARSARRITNREAHTLYRALRETLLNAIEYRGSTSRNYRDAFGQTGSAQDLHAVYNRGGRPCLVCRSSLRATRVGGRGTVYCPQCQS